MMKQWTTLFVFLFLSLSLSAQQGYGRDIFVSSKGDSLPYRMIHPESVKPGEKYPLVLFLHGAGERGNDNEKQLTHGGQMFPVGLITSVLGFGEMNYGYQAMSDMTVIVSSGIAGWGYPLRTGSHSEYVIVDIVKE